MIPPQRIIGDSMCMQLVDGEQRCARISQDTVAYLDRDVCIVLTTLATALPHGTLPHCITGSIDRLMLDVGQLSDQGQADDEWQERDERDERFGNRAAELSSFVARADAASAHHRKIEPAVRPRTD